MVYIFFAMQGIWSRMRLSVVFLGLSASSLLVSKAFLSFKIQLCCHLPK